MKSQSQSKAPDLPATLQAGLLQRKCGCGNHAMSGNCDDCAKKKSLLQRNVAHGIESSEAPSIVNDVLRSPGQTLDAATRVFMEPRFGRDFSHVRVHTDLSSAQSATAVNALAYTVGNHIVFATGQYAPGTPAGRTLLAHELTHTVQQRGGLAQNSSALDVVTDSRSEQEADAAASAVSSGHAAFIGREHNLRLARQTPGSIGAVPTYETATLKPAAKEPCPFTKGSCSGGKWNVEYDGCSVPASLANLAGIDPNNPAGGSKTQFALCSPSGGKGRGCDRHDECYQTCNPTPAAQAACDQRMYQDNLKVCLSYAENSAMRKECFDYATTYFLGLRSFGRAAFCERQLTVCGCEKNHVKLEMAKKLCNVALEKPERSLAPAVSTGVTKTAAHGSDTNQESQLEKPERSLAPAVSTAVGSRQFRNSSEGT